MSRQLCAKCGWTVGYYWIDHYGPYCELCAELIWRFIQTPPQWVEDKP